MHIHIELSPETDRMPDLGASAAQIAGVPKEKQFHLGIAHRKGTGIGCFNALQKPLDEMESLRRKRYRIAISNWATQQYVVGSGQSAPRIAT